MRNVRRAFTTRRRRQALASSARRATGGPSLFVDELGFTFAPGADDTDEFIPVTPRIVRDELEAAGVEFANERTPEESMPVLTRRDPLGTIADAFVHAGKDPDVLLAGVESAARGDLDPLHDALSDSADDFRRERESDQRRGETDSSKPARSSSGSFIPFAAAAALLLAGG